MIFPTLKDYFVDDLVDEDSEIIFVLESPHTDEIKNGYPVAGKSGKDMSKVLFGLSEPFGKLLYEKKITNIGILNVSNYPLQKSAYKNQNLQDLEFFELIRQNPKLRKYDKNSINQTTKKIMLDFKNRLSTCRDKKIVLCGNFAQNAFDYWLDDKEFQEVLRVPHPSFNNWTKIIYKQKIENLKDFIR